MAMRPSYRNFGGRRSAARGRSRLWFAGILILGASWLIYSYRVPKTGVEIRDTGQFSERRGEPRIPEDLVQLEIILVAKRHTQAIDESQTQNREVLKNAVILAAQVRQWSYFNMRALPKQQDAAAEQIEKFIREHFGVSLTSDVSNDLRSSDDLSSSERRLDQHIRHLLIEKKGQSAGSVFRFTSKRMIVNVGLNLLETSGSRLGSATDAFGAAMVEKARSDLEDTATAIGIPDTHIQALSPLFRQFETERDLRSLKKRLDRWADEAFRILISRNEGASTLAPNAGASQQIRPAEDTNRQTNSRHESLHDQKVSVCSSDMRHNIRVVFAHSPKDPYNTLSG
jgi:hypothetical protein